jgi:putative hemolysin
VTDVDWILIAVVILLFILAGFLAVAETSLVRTSRHKAIALNDDQRRGAKALLKLVNQPESFLHPVLFLVFLSQTIAATLIGIVLGHIFSGIVLVLVIAIEVLIVFVIFEAIPKNWALKHSEKAALLTAPVIEVLTKFKIFNSLSGALDKIANSLVKNKGEASEITESEILALADVAADDSVIERSESALIHSVLNFGDTIVREVMMPRPDLVAIEANEPVSAGLDKALSHGYSRLPVYDDTLDNIIGIAVTKDLVSIERDNKGGEPVKNYVREVHFVPETKRVAPLLRQMQKESFHLAVVVDEYGATAGIVTMEDLIEEIVGEIVDEYDVAEPEIEKLPNGDIKFSAKLSIEAANQLTRLELPAGDWDTIGGLLLEMFGHVPAVGESVRINGATFFVEKLVGRRIARIRMHKDLEEIKETKVV